MAFTQISRPGTPELFRDELVNLVNSHFDWSEKFYHPVRMKLPRLYDVWRGIYTGRFHPHKNNVHVPLIYAAVWADAARKAATSINSWPIVQFRGYGPNDKPMAVKHENLISAQMKDASAFVKEVNTHVLAGLYGDSVSKVMWDRRTEHVVYDEYHTMPLSEERVRQIREADVITFDGPNWVNVDLLDFYPQPGFRLISEMKRAGDRFYIDLDDCRRLAMQPVAGNHPPVFDPVEVARMEREGSGADKSADDASNRRYMARLGMSDDMSRNMDRYARPVEIRELWGVIPSEYAIDGQTNVVLTVANRKYLMRARGNPFWHRQKPYVKHSPCPDPHYFYSPGKAEVAEKLQLTANRYVNQRLDAGDLIIDPMWFYDRNAGIDTNNLYAKTGRWIATDGPPREKVQPMEVNIQGMQVGVGLTAEMTAYIERATGIVDDAVAGLQGPQAQTAREFVGRREAAGTRLMLESRLYEEQYLEPLANLMHKLNRQYLEGPVEVHMIGENAEKDPDTGEPIEAGREVLKGYELAVSYIARAVGASRGLSKLIRRQELVPLLQVVSNSEYTAGAVNFVNFLRQIFREFDIDNVNEVLKSNAQQGGPLGQVMGQAAGPGANPEGVPDTAAGTGDGGMAMAQFLGQ